VPTTPAQRTAIVAKALSHPVRVQIVGLLAAQTECRGADLFAELPLAQSTVSEHLRILRDAGVVSSRPVGASAVYCLHPEVLSEFAAQVGELASAAPVCASGRSC